MDNIEINPLEIAKVICIVFDGKIDYKSKKGSYYISLPKHDKYRIRVSNHRMSKLGKKGRNRSVQYNIEFIRKVFFKKHIFIVLNKVRKEICNIK